jgi:hypothetical protein
MTKASRFRRSLVHRKHETIRKYILRARDEGLWEDDVANEGLLVWLDKYEAVRFGGVELSEGEFLGTMKLVYFLLMGMQPPESSEVGGYPRVSMSSNSSSFSTLSRDSMESFTGDGGSISRRQASSEQFRANTYVMRQMESLLTSPRKSCDTVSVTSMIDHGSELESVIDQEEREQQMRGGRLGEREGSVIYYNMDD